MKGNFKGEDLEGVHEALPFLISIITVYLYFSMNSVDYFSSDCKVDSDCATNKCNKKTGKCE